MDAILSRLSIDWTLLGLMTVSFVLSAAAGAAGWAQRAGRAGTLRGCLIAAANCGVIGLIGCGTVLRSSPASFLSAFLAGLVAAWTLGRFGARNWPEALGRVTLALDALRGKFPGKSDQD